MGESYKFGDSLWDLVRKILGWMEDIATSIAPGGGSGGAGSSVVFSTAPDVTVAVAGIRVQASSNAVRRGVLITAKSTNTGSVYVGDANVSNNAGGRRGMELVPAGMTPVLLAVTNTNEIYINADNAGDKVGILIL